MKLNSPESLELARKAFRRYDGSWTAAREAGHRDPNGVLVIPVKQSDLAGASGRPNHRSSKGVETRRSGLGK